MLQKSRQQLYSLFNHSVNSLNLFFFKVNKKVENNFYFFGIFFFKQFSQTCLFLLMLYLLTLGSCNDRESRWFYNHQTQNCESFIYSGCGGNANHFLTEEACQSRCVIGACCHRKPLFKRRLVGYNLDNYDRQATAGQKAT